jgi:hypothetical protein
LFGLGALAGEAAAFGVLERERSGAFFSFNGRAHRLTLPYSTVAQSQLNADQSQLAQLQHQLVRVHVGISAQSRIRQSNGAAAGLRRSHDAQLNNKQRQRHSAAAAFP